MRNRANKSQNISAAVSCDCSLNFVVQGSVFLLPWMLHPCSSLEDTRFLLLQFFLESRQECSGRWVVALEQGLKPTVPALNRICSSSDPVSASRMLAPKFDWKHRWSMLFSPPSPAPTPDVGVLEVSNYFIQTVDLLRHCLHEQLK